MPVDQTHGIGSVKAAKVLGWWYVCIFWIVVSTQTGLAVDLEFITALGEFEKNEGLVISYDINSKDHFFNLKIGPTTPFGIAEAKSVGRGVCAVGAQSVGSKLADSWTVRVFLPEQTIPAFSCQIPGRHNASVRARPRRAGPGRSGNPQ
jgi:hypothetical protein